MSSVKKFVDEYLEMKAVAENMEESKVRFSVTVSPEVNRRLEYCSKELDHSRSGLANVIIEKALSDVEDALGLKFHEGEELTDYAKYVFTSAGEVRSDKEVS